MHVSTLHAGMSGMGRSRSPDSAWISAIWSLYISTTLRQSVLVLDHAEVLAAETDGAREDDLRVDAALVEHLEPHLRVVGADVDVVDRPLVEPDVGALLLPVTADDRGRGGLPEHVSVEHPRRNALDLLHAGHTVDELGRCDPGEEVVRLGEVGVGVDDEGAVVQH